MWTACSLPGFFQLERYAILPRSHDWQKLHWFKSAWKSLIKKKRQKKKQKKQVLQIIKVKSWIKYSVHYSKTTACLKYQKNILKIYAIQTSFWQFQWFIVHKKDSSKRILTFTKELNLEQANQTAHRSCSCYVIIFYCCSGPVLLAGEKKTLGNFTILMESIQETLSLHMPKLERKSD